MKKSKKSVLASATLMGLVLTLSNGVKAADNEKVNRVGGETRYKTAQNLAKKEFKTSENVILVSGTGYADAVSAAPFAKQLNAPILLTEGKVAEAELFQTLKDLGAKKVFVVGGEGVISSTVLDALKDYNAERIGGLTRYETNAEITKRVLSKSESKGAILVNGEDGYADALSVAPIAAKKGYGILLANSREVPAAVKSLCVDLKVLAVGGQAVLPDNVVKSVNGQRITEKAGDRFETNLSLLNHFKGELNFDNIFIASGGNDNTSNFADALVASAVAGKYGAPVILSGLGASESNKNAALEFIKSNAKNINRASLIGALGVMDSDIEEGVKSALSGKETIDNNNSSNTTGSGSSSSGGSSSSSGGSSSSSGGSSSSSGGSSSSSTVISPVSLNKGGTYKGDCTISNIDKNSTFGPENDTTIINGNLNIIVPKAVDGQTLKLKNLDIKGDISVDFGSGNVEFENVKVKGVQVNNIGENSLHIKGDTHIGVLTIKDTDSNAHIVIESDTSVIDDTSINSGAKLQIKDGVTSLNPFGTIKIAPAKDGETIILDGSFGSVQLEKGAKVQIAPNAKILGKLILNSAAEVSLGENALVNKVDVSTDKESDKVVLKGNFKNVEINKKADIELKSGNSNVTSNVKVEVNVDKDASVDIRGNKENILNKGEGQAIEKTEKSSDNEIKAILINGSKIEYGNEIKEIPAGTKISKLIQNLQLPDFAKAYVKDENQNKISEDEYVFNYCDLVVEAENGDTKYYNVQLAKENTRSILNVEFNGFTDKNLEEKKLSGTINFTVKESEEDIQGYYIIVEHKDLWEPMPIRKQVFRKFVPYDKASNKKYSVNIDNIDISNMNNKELKLLISASYKNRFLIPRSEHEWQLIDLPYKSGKPSSDGIKISFKDTDNRKGKIDGDIKFTKATKEENIKYYQVEIEKEYSNDGKTRNDFSEIGIVKATGQDTYTYTLNKYFMEYLGLENAKEISIVITARNEYGESAEEVSLKVEDLGTDAEGNFKAPVLELNSDDDKSLKVSGATTDSAIKVYTFDETKKEYIPYLKDGRQLTIYLNLYRDDKTPIYDLNPGKYKVTQEINGKESEMSEEVILKPSKLVAVINETAVTFTNAQVGATIELFDESKENKIKTIVIEKPGDAKFDGLAKGKYYLRQYMNNIYGDYTEIGI